MIGAIRLHCPEEGKDFEAFYRLSSVGGQGRDRGLSPAHGSLLSKKMSHPVYGVTGEHARPYGSSNAKN